MELQPIDTTKSRHTREHMQMHCCFPVDGDSQADGTSLANTLTAGISEPRLRLRLIPGKICDLHNPGKIWVGVMGLAIAAQGNPLQDLRLPWRWRWRLRVEGIKPAPYQICGLRNVMQTLFQSCFAVRAMVRPVFQLAGCIAVVHSKATFAFLEAGLEAQGVMIVLELDVLTACTLTDAQAGQVERKEMMGGRSKMHFNDGGQLPANAHDPVVKSVAGYTWNYIAELEDALAIWFASWREDGRWINPAVVGQQRAVVGQQRAKADIRNHSAWITPPFTRV